jgi:hypothetical protein
MSSKKYEQAILWPKLLSQLVTQDGLDSSLGCFAIDEGNDPVWSEALSKERSFHSPGIIDCIAELGNSWVLVVVNADDDGPRVAVEKLASFTW